jgi:hypothetical protein
VRGWAALKASGKSGLALGTALVAAGFVAGLLFDRHTAEPGASLAPVAAAPAPNAASREPMSAPPLLSEAESKPAVAPEPRAKRHARPPSAQKSARESSDAFDRELALVQRAERAIRNRDPALALALLAELDRRHPRPLLGEERAAARVMANCQAKEPTAPLAAERFLADSASSVYTDRIRALCGLAPR